MISTRFGTLTPTRSETLKPGDENYDRTKKRYEHTKNQVEEARDFFISQDNIKGVDADPAKGSVVLEKAKQDPQAPTAFTGSLKDNGDFEYTKGTGSFAYGAQFGEAKTDDDGITTYFSYSDPGAFEVLTYYSVTNMAADGTIFLESGRI